MAYAEKTNIAQALALANQTRLARAALKREIRSFSRFEASTLAADIIADPPPECQRMKARDLLMSIHLWGNQRVEHALRRAGASHLKTLEELTERQRKVLTELLVGSTA